MNGIYTYIPETNHVPKQYNVAAILSLLFMVPISLAPTLALMYFYIRTLLFYLLLLLLLLFWVFLLLYPSLQGVCATMEGLYSIKRRHETLTNERDIGLLTL
jgi:uncharacterized membrane protein